MIFKVTAKNQNFEMYAGDTKNIEVTIAGVNLTGASVKWALKRTVYEADAVISKDTTGGISITNASGGVFVIALAPGDTTSLSGDYYHEAEITDSASNVSTVFTGKATINLSGV